MKLPVNYDKIHYRERRAVREEYIKLQGGKCCHCGAGLDRSASSEIRCLKVSPGLYPNGFFNSPVHLHHDHDTGMTIGAVHCHCNAVLWEYHGE